MCVCVRPDVKSSQAFTNFGGVQPLPPVIATYLDKQAGWMDAMIAQNPSDPYWRQVAVILTQLHGLSDGYNRYSPPSEQMTFQTLQLQSIGADLMTLFQALLPSQWTPLQQMSTEHCSALVKLAPDNGELFVGHSTWGQLQVHAHSRPTPNAAPPPSRCAPLCLRCSSIPLLPSLSVCHSLSFSLSFFLSLSHSLPLSRFRLCSASLIRCVCVHPCHGWDR